MTHQLYISRDDDKDHYLLMRVGGELDQMIRAKISHWADGVRVYPLHGALDPEEDRLATAFVYELQNHFDAVEQSYSWCLADCERYRNMAKARRVEAERIAAQRDTEAAMFAARQSKVIDYAEMRCGDLHIADERTWRIRRTVR